MKELLTNKEIEKDVIEIVKNTEPKSNHNNDRLVAMIPIVVIGVIAVTALFKPSLILWEILAVALLVIGVILFDNHRKRKRIQNITLDDYCITKETVRSVCEDEHVTDSVSRPYAYKFCSYSICFENERTWLIPKECYTWSKEHRMTDHGIFQTTQKGDVMTVVAKKDTGRIVVAYNSAIFEYKNT